MILSAAMNRNLAWILGVAALLAVLFVFMRTRSESPYSPLAVKPQTPSARSNEVATAGQLATPPSVESTNDRGPVASAREPEDLFSSPAFKQTEIARRWAAQGVTDTDIASAIHTLRQRGFEGNSLCDPALVQQFLPARIVRPFYLDSIELPETVAAGQPVPFTVHVNMPSPAYRFDRWEIRVEGSTVIVRPIGTRSADPVAAVVVPAQFTGELPGMEPGERVIRFEAIGEPVERTLRVQ